MQVDGLEADFEEVAVAVDGSVIWRCGVRYIPDPDQADRANATCLVRLCRHCGEAIELRDTALDGVPFWCHIHDQRYANPPHKPEPG